MVREACSRLPLLGEHGHDIRSQTHEIGSAMVRELQQDASAFGVRVQRLCIVEARYAPEIASQMLMKQQAVAIVAARKEIVAGALNVVRDTLQVGTNYDACSCRHDTDVLQGFDLGCIRSLTLSLASTISSSTLARSGYTGFLRSKCGDDGDDDNV